MSQTEVDALDYMAIRQRFFGESAEDAERHMMGLPALRRVGQSNRDLIRDAVTSLLRVDAANAKWGPQ